MALDIEYCLYMGWGDGAHTGHGQDRWGPVWTLDDINDWAWTLYIGVYSLDMGWRDEVHTGHMV